MGKPIFCHLCRGELRDCGMLNGNWLFSCDDETYPTDFFKIEIITKPAKQHDGSYLSVL